MDWIPHINEMLILTENVGALNYKPTILYL